VEGVKDNLKRIDELFECRKDDKFADGYAYFCKECDLECNVSEAVFTCQDGKVIPTFIVCRYGCGARWNLKICASGEQTLVSIQ
jgi:hypothetical protein